MIAGHKKIADVCEWMDDNGNVRYSLRMVVEQNGQYVGELLISLPFNMIEDYVDDLTRAVRRVRNGRS